MRRGERKIIRAHYRWNRSPLPPLTKKQRFRGDSGGVCKSDLDAIRWQKCMNFFGFRIQERLCDVVYSGLAVGGQKGAVVLKHQIFLGHIFGAQVHWKTFQMNSISLWILTLTKKKTSRCCFKCTIMRLTRNKNNFDYALEIDLTSRTWPFIILYHLRIIVFLDTSLSLVFFFFF